MLPFFPIAGYAELHYRFKFGFTLLSRRSPEIYFDAPHRVEPGIPVPAILLIKDADRHPVELLRITAAIAIPGNHRVFLKEITPDKKQISSRFFWQLFYLPLPDGLTGVVRLTFKLDYRIRGRETFLLNDNLPFGSHSDFPVRVSGHPLPCLPGYVLGETHFHSELTTDQIEFGAPLEVVPAMAKAMGLKFAAALDHSYDLDPRNPFKEKSDPFASLLERCKTLSGPEFLLLGGEEVSVRNSRGKTVHMGLLGGDQWMAGYGDCGRSLSDIRCEHDIREVLEAEGHGLAFAAHPGYRETTLERLLLNRGRWETADFQDGLSVLQIWNGARDRTFYAGYREWKRLLQAGKRVFAIAGNDAHGDFNRTRKISIPFISVAENFDLKFGLARTAVKTDVLTPESLLGALRSGRAVMTDGPMLDLGCVHDGKRFETGEEVRGSSAQALITGVTSPEFGCFDGVRVLKGIPGKGEAVILESKPGPAHTFSLPLPLPMDEPAYYRAEASTRLDKNVFYAFTNPFWVEPGKS